MQKRKKVMMMMLMTEIRATLTTFRRRPPPRSLSKLKPLLLLLHRSPFPISKSLSSNTYSSSSISKCISATADEVLDVDEEEGSNTKLISGFLQPRVVIYDGVCHLCHNGVRWLIRVDEYRQIKFCCLQSKAAEPYLSYCGLKRKDVLQRFLFVEGPNTYSQGSTAALRIASYLPPPYSALQALMIIPAVLRDAIYDYIAKHRYDWFGKEEDCEALQDPEVLQRFIDRKEIWDRCVDKYRADSH